jgi:hypothetical protein
MSVNGRRVPLLLIVSVMVAAMLVPVFRPHKATAAQITNRALTLMDGPVDGGAKPGGVVNHKFTFTLPTASTVGSIKFEYCTIASIETCVTPQNLSTTGASVALDETGSGATGFSLTKTTNGAPYIHRTAASISANTAMSIKLTNVTNPNVLTPTPQPNYTFFVRITSYASEDASGSPIDTGSVAASTSTQIVLTGTMPESLIFCTGATVSTTNGIPDCSTATAGDVTFNQLFSPSDTANAKSQMSASTNALSGYSISVDGTTLTSGSNTIPALASADTSKKGTGQFGMNLRLNTTAAAPGFSVVGSSADITPASNGSDLRANPASGFATADTFTFTPGLPIARSDSNTGTPGPTNSQIYTASYIVNVTGAQPAGTYSTTLTYICTATF